MEGVGFPRPGNKKAAFSHHFNQTPVHPASYTLVPFTRAHHNCGYVIGYQIAPIDLHWQFGLEREKA